MTPQEIEFHLKAGWRAGEDRTCGKKVDYKYEESAVRAATKMSEAYDRDMEAYPCCFCEGWHIGGRFNRE